MRRIPWSPVLALVFTLILFRGWTVLPLGIPGEWTWERILWTDDNLAETLLGICLALLAGALYVAFACWGLPYFVTIDLTKGTKRSSITVFLWLCGLWVMANGWVLALQQSPPEPYNLTKATWVTYYPSTSGYFYHARYRIVDVSSFLSEYEAWMREGDVLHVGTHPPGLYLLNYKMLYLCERSSVLTDLLIATMPGEIVRGLEDINSHFRSLPRELKRSDRSALWGMILLTQGIALATIFPIFGVVRCHFSDRAAWQVSTLWPLIPALNVFLPKSDTLYPFLTLLLVWCALQGVRRKSWLWGCSTGFVLWLGLSMSLALLPGLVLTLLLVVWEIFTSHRANSQSTRGESSTTSAWSQYIAPIIAMGGSFALLVALVWWLTDLNLLNCWRMNLQNHAGFYTQYPRTYWIWLLVNPFELAIAFGLPVTFAVISSYGRAGVNFRRLPYAAWGPLICCPLVWSLLWLSGKNMGEAARLWIFLLPWGLWTLAQRWTIGTDDAELERDYSWLMVAQMIATIVTVTGVSGFHILQI
ncbi:MAG: hypothetical protein O2955_06105 [Planctomycetota bacterium]|nr:hypothetical protein [Planctomycetota bacterium]MDA1212067.1 hypothetical protein [Planctomycetota bacterium]